MNIKYLTIVLLVLLCSCDKMYEKYPKGSKVTKAMLQQAKQIIILKNGYRIVVIDELYNRNGYRPFMLFYTSTNQLESICYLPGEISRITRDTIYGVSTEHMQSQKWQYVKDLPKPFVLNLTPIKYVPIDYDARTVEKIEIDSATVAVTLCITPSKDKSSSKCDTLRLTSDRIGIDLGRSRFDEYAHLLELHYPNSHSGESVIIKNAEMDKYISELLRLYFR
jgi:hypothetical protein